MKFMLAWNYFLNKVLHFKFLHLFLCVLLIPSLVGCSTIYGRQNDKQNIFFETNAEGAEITCGNEAVQTPGNLILKQSKTHTCTATAEGYEPKVFRVRSQISKKGFDHSSQMNWAKWGKWTLGIGNLIGWPIDFISGSMRDFKQDRYEIELRSSAETGKGQKIMTKTANVGRAILEMPKNLTDGTTNVVLDSTLRTSAQQVGLANEEKRQAVEDQIEGKRLMDHLDTKYGTPTKETV